MTKEITHCDLKMLSLCYACDVTPSQIYETQSHLYVYGCTSTDIHCKLMDGLPEPNAPLPPCPLGKGK